MVEIVWTARALNDIDQIAEYISKDSFMYATRIVERIFYVEELLLLNTRIGRMVPEFHNNVIREVIIGNYRVVYRIYSAKEIQMLTVHHGAKRLTKTSIY